MKHYFLQKNVQVKNPLTTNVCISQITKIHRYPRATEVPRLTRTNGRQQMLRCTFMDFMPCVSLLTVHRGWWTGGYDTSPVEL